MSVFSSIRDGLARTTRQLVSRLEGILGQPGATAPRSGPPDPETLEALEDALIAADVGVPATALIIGAVRSLPATASMRASVKAEILRILQAADRPVVNGGSPRVVLVVGVNGTGKTTTVGKLANLARLAGQHPVICAADTFRAAAVEQLAVWAARAGVDFVRTKASADPASVVFDAIAAGKARGRDPVIVDTAGRLHTRVNLMNELEKIRRVASREVPGAPHEVLLVLDATVGQNGLVQAREFLQAVGVSGIVLTKLDGTAKGGIAVAIAHELKLPIRFVGVGESLDDLVPFSPQDYVDALFEETW